ncbi:hypothetical protein [Psychroserpens algicola]|uniref:Immunity protein 50 n=1 Tax=Psychroserpens algicola TaxID=1719034 RepID=A0ABT0HAR6_9FLAO|nr:hypothetical protein [Psychroserpens algicola]MCK8480940.1 hypothetical protein [Psychroserpens algicola]
MMKTTIDKINSNIKTIPILDFSLERHLNDLILLGSYDLTYYIQIKIVFKEVNEDNIHYSDYSFDFEYFTPLSVIIHKNDYEFIIKTDEENIKIKCKNFSIYNYGRQGVNLSDIENNTLNKDSIFHSINNKYG